MKRSKPAFIAKHRIPEIRFEDQRLSSFAGLVLFPRCSIGFGKNNSRLFPASGRSAQSLVMELLLIVHAGIPAMICVTTRMTPWCAVCWGIARSAGCRDGQPYAGGMDSRSVGSSCADSTGSRFCNA